MPVPGGLLVTRTTTVPHRRRAARRRPVIRAAAAGAAGLLGLGLSAAWITSSADAAPENRPELGVYVGNTPDDVARFETFIGSPVDAVLVYTGDRSWEDADPGWFINLWAPTKHKVLWSIPMTPKGTGAQAFREAATGQHDAHYTHWARETLDSRSGDDGPIYVRSTWELGSEWFEWTQAAKDDPQAYIGAWQHFAGDFPRGVAALQVGVGLQRRPGQPRVVLPRRLRDRRHLAGRLLAAAVHVHRPGQGLRHAGLGRGARPGLDGGLRPAAREAGGDLRVGRRRERRRSLHSGHAEVDHDARVVYATYWNGGEGSGYDSEQMSGRWPQAAQTLRDLFALPGQPGTGSPRPTVSPTATDSPTVSPTATDSPTESPTPTDSPTGSPTGTASPTPTDSPTGTGTAQPSPPASVTRTIGHGPRRLVLKISQDAYRGDARYLVRVDGRRVVGCADGGREPRQRRRRHAGRPWSLDRGPHTVTVTFLNDSYGGTPDSDRNLYVDGITLDGNAVADGSAVLYAAGDRTFALD